MSQRRPPEDPVVVAMRRFKSAAFMFAAYKDGKATSTREEREAELARMFTSLNRLSPSALQKFTPDYEKNEEATSVKFEEIFKEYVGKKGFFSDKSRDIQPEFLAFVQKHLKQNPINEGSLLSKWCTENGIALQNQNLRKPEPAPAAPTPAPPPARPTAAPEVKAAAPSPLRAAGVQAAQQPKPAPAATTPARPAAPAASTPTPPSREPAIRRSVGFNSIADEYSAARQRALASQQQKPKEPAPAEPAPVSQRRPSR